MSEWEEVCECIGLFEKKRRTIVFLHFCLSKELPKHLVQLDAKAKPLATLNM